MKTRTILPLLVLAVLAWLPGIAQADTATRPSVGAPNFTKTAFGEY